MVSTIFKQAQSRSFWPTKGFTLIELMIAVMIMAFLSAVAYPAYTDQVRKSKRAALVTDIMQCAGILERRFTIRNTYESTACDNAVQNEDYVISITLPTTNGCVTNTRNNCFNINAVAVAGSYMAKDATCAAFNYNHLGEKTSNKNGSTDNNAKTCWRS